MKLYVCMTVLLIIYYPQNFINGQYASRDVHPKIVGGSSASEGQFPYQVSLRKSNDKHFCGGSILNNRWILTAAHCLRGFSDTDITVVVGTTKLDSGGDIYHSSRIIEHENYSSLLIRNDIGLIHLDKTITFNDYVQPINLPTSGDLDKSNYYAVLSGWGTTSYPGSIPNALQFISLKVISYKECRGFSMRVTKRNICTLNGKGEGSCHGDSGGPLVVDGTQVGIVSWGKPCAVGEPDVFTRVYSYTDWIKKNMNDDVDDEHDFFI